ncbi:alpha/beta fold hydrolase [Actinotalea solisilvae]|uniref:alpha/beta fold hydrolase n=1 Tax=Actinotalea solisilvae TaxID=2072922 RepID=UPI0027DCE007|nr:alpha/beta fold hydrolase [Actinotalea solisilvae]
MSTSTAAPTGTTAPTGSAAGPGLTAATGTPAPPRTGVLRVPGATLHHELRGDGPLVALVAAPMDADSMAPLADLLATDHTVLTTDPRGIHRSTVDDPERDTTPEDRAADLALLLRHLDRGPAHLLGSSGGAVTVLALAQAHPELVGTVVAHEPPLQQLLPDREDLARRTDAMRDAYLAGDVRGAWQAFLEAAAIELPPEVVDAMASPDRPAGALADERYQFEHMLHGTSQWRPDVERLRALGSRVVVGIGEASAGQLCDRASRALAAALGTSPTLFPGDHLGFLEEPVPFAARLREVLAPDPSALDARFSAPIEKDGAFATYLTVPGSAALLGTRRAVKVEGLLDGHPFAATLMPSGEGPHWLPLRAALCRAIGKGAAGDVVDVRLLRRLT